MNVDMDDVHGLFQDAPFGRIRREISGGDSPRRYLPRGIPSGAGLDACVAACLFPLALFILLNGLDDVVLDLALAWDWIARRRSRAADDTPEAPPSPEKRIAIFVPLWREHEVIQGMVSHNIAAIRYASYDFFIGAYPNDDATKEAVRELERRYPNVHLAVCAHDGPTSKADCLNWIFQRMLLFEEEHGVRFEIVVTHDAEDLIHPDALRTINEHGDRHDMVQIPVLPLATPLADLVHGIYCDEFAEYQTKDIPARLILRAFLPSNGVGTGFSRAALEKLASACSNQIFNPVCLTEDYENGIRLHRHGFRQTFVRLDGNCVATREYFPRSIRTAIRQRTRWITGISLQSWDLNGWGGGIAQCYWLWRDRKGLITNPVGLFSNVLFGYGLITWIAARLNGAPWGLARDTLHPALFVAILALQLFHMGFRMFSVSRYFGWRFATAVPLRILLANVINCVATFRAEYRFFRAKLLGEPLVWLKTEHVYPSRAALVSHKRLLGEILVGSSYITYNDLARGLATQPPGVRIGEHLVALGWLSEDDLCEALTLQQGLPAGRLRANEIDRRVARALPRTMAREWKALPFRVADGAMMIATPEIPGEEMESALRPLTSLRIRFHLVTKRNFAELAEALL